MDKVNIDIRGDTATIEKGRDTLVGKLLAQKGKFKIRGREVKITSGLQPETPIEGKPKHWWNK
ncbi:MAG: hypothetical protein MUP81_00715 [Dehalococcoidia bacterium]|nr:hypothetical protein [Dehalococcoidia bacterium]